MSPKMQGVSFILKHVLNRAVPYFLSLLFPISIVSFFIVAL